MNAEPQSSSERAAHWDRVYRAKSEQELSWFQAEPAQSLELIQRYSPRNARIIDVGGGSSDLGGRLAGLDYDVTVLDISAAALERAQSRIGEVAQRMRWIVGDITIAPDLGRFDLWHDRAVFHFLTDVADQRAYVARAATSVVTGGHIVLGAFAPGGPPTCSGLPVHRHDKASLSDAFAPTFSLVEHAVHAHLTPWGKSQPFIFAVIRRND